MNEPQKKVLDFLEKNLEEDEYEGGAYFSFAPICNATGLDRKTVRLACRYLKRKGLARFYAGLWDNDGGFRGSGYSAMLKSRTEPKL